MRRSFIISSVPKFFASFTDSQYGIGTTSRQAFYKLLGTNSRVPPAIIKQKRMNILKDKLLTGDYGDQAQANFRKSILFLIKEKTYRGVRHMLGYPARGQRTHTNARTKRKWKH